MNQTYLILGSNIGDRSSYLAEARALIKKGVGSIQSVSSIYETEPWGKKKQHYFLNQALLVTTSLTAQQLIVHLQSIEERMGRLKREKWGHREIDIDILFFNDEVITDDNLIIPHPHISKRQFVLAPLAEIAPQFVHPIAEATIQELLERCTDTSAVSIQKTF